MSEVTKEQVVDYLSNLSVIDIGKLVGELEESWGVSAAPVAVAGVAGPAADGAAAEEAPTEFNVLLTDFGAKKIQVIKAVREITGLGLKEAKDLVEGVPKELKEGLDKGSAEEIVAKIKEAGGSCEIKPA